MSYSPIERASTFELVAAVEAGGEVRDLVAFGGARVRARDGDRPVVVDDGRASIGARSRDRRRARRAACRGAGMTPYYDHAGIRIFHGDCRGVLPTLEPVDVVITDPPYSETTHAGARTSGGGVLLDGAFGCVDAALLRSVFALALPRRWLVSFVDWKHVTPLSDEPPSGLEFVRFGVWVKPNGMPQLTGDRPSHGWEAVGIWHRAGVAKRWNGGGHHAVWTCNKENGPHPTMKPLRLVGQFVRLFSDPGETILDPFMGSGTTLVAAKQAGRMAIGIEREERYCEAASKRLEQEVLDLAPVPSPLPEQAALLAPESVR